MRPSIKEIRQAAADYFGVTPDEMVGDGSVDSVQARSIAMFIAHTTGHSTRKIAMHFERSHTAVFRGVRAVETQLKRGEWYAEVGEVWRITNQKGVC
jgi:chromosomal replication initiation ATPase DnaA